jgi:hypothetical protein
MEAQKVDLPEMSKGEWRVEHFITDKIDFYAIMYGRGFPLGETFTRLMRGNTLVMSDTPAERYDHYDAIRKATGSCLINGLGLGMVLKNILLKPDVTDVTVVEISQDLIDLISPHYCDPRITYVCHDAYTYKPEKGKRFNMVWHDIWDNMCEDNLPEMAKLHRKYGRRTDWQDSWGKRIILRHRR